MRGIFMGIIAFIKVLAFISSIGGRIIALPFIIIFHILKLCLRMMRSLKHEIFNLKQKKRKRRIDKYEKKTARRKMQQERRRKKEEEKFDLKQKKRKHRIEKHEKKTARRKMQQERRRKRDEEKRLAYELRQKKAKLTFLKGNPHLYAQILRKIYLALMYVLHKMYWGGRWICNKLYWGAHFVLQKLYWGAHFVLQKLYWGAHFVFQKIYWKTYTIFQKIYWVSYSCVQKIYWNYYVKSRKVYASITKNTYIDLFFVFFRSYLTKRNIQIRCINISGVKEYVNKHRRDSKYRIIEKGIFRTVCIPSFFERNEESHEEFISPDIYVAQIAHVDLIGGSNVVIADNTLLNDTAAYDMERRTDICYSAIKKVVNGVAIIEENDDIEYIKHGINLVGAASFNYYHLVVEILSRLTFIDYFEEYREYPILVDEVVMRIPQFKSALERINQLKHPIIVIEKEKKYHIEDLILPSSNVWMPTNLYDRNAIQVEDFLIADSVLHNIRKAVGVWNERKPWRKIFISRKNTQAVRLSNELNVRNIFADNGFEIVYTEEMTFQQQVECFGQAKCVVATSGAALTNTIFCQEETVIGCIIPSEHRFYMYSTIAYLLGMKSLFLDAHITDKTPYAAADTFELDEEYVQRYIAELKKILV